MPFGFDGMLWRLMGEGIDWMIAVALFVASLPGAVGRMAAFGVGPLLLGTGGLVLLCLLKTPLRWSGGVRDRCGEPLGDPHAAAGRAGLVRRPGGGGARRGRHGLRSIAAAATPLPSREWLAADGDARLPDDATLGAGLPLRPVRLHRQAARRQAGRAGARRRCLRGGLPPRRGRRDRPRGAAGLPGADRSTATSAARPGRDRAQAQRRGLRD